jgi:hypothetical protein
MQLNQPFGKDGLTQSLAVNAAAEWPTLFHTWVWNIHHWSLCTEARARKLSGSSQQSISPTKTHEEN